MGESGILGDTTFTDSDGDDDGDGGVLPSWLKDLKTLTGVSALGVSLTDDPIGFVRAVVIEWSINGVLAATAELVGTILLAWSQVVDAFVMAGAALLEPFGILGDIVIMVIALVGDIVVAIASIAGPFAPIIVVVLWGGIAIGVGYLLRSGLEVVKWVT